MRTLRGFIREKFGQDVLKIPVNAGFSCPNKENGNFGCLFCDNVSFSPVAKNIAITPKDIVEQFCQKRDKMSHKFSLFMPYLQPNTNTYASVEKLRQIYEPLISEDGVVGLAIGTRPDAINTQIVEYLDEVNKKTYLSIELGLQSANDETLDFIKRGHSAEDFSEACIKLAEKNIEVVAHVMLGLPKSESETENIDDAINTAKFISNLPISGVKIHQLMIIRNTPLQKLYEDGQIKVFTVEEYAEALAAFVSYLRKDIVIHRLMADSTVENGLIAPLWSADKAQMLNYLRACI